MLSVQCRRGFTLIEALIALVVLLAGLVGGATVLLQTLHHEREAAWRRSALRHAASLAEELRAIRGHSARPAAAEPAVIAAWTADVIASLPQGASAAVNAGEAQSELRIDIAWPGANGRQQVRLPVLP